MAIIQNAALARIRAGEVAIGISVSLIKSVAIAQLSKTAGYHWLAIDTEHGALTIGDASQISLAALPLGITPIVRVKADALDEAARALDNGAQGIMIPNVGTAADARRATEALRYAPQGRRSWGSGTAQFEYAPPPLDQALPQVNEQVLIAAMIETEEGLANVDAIAAVPGIDVLFVGASDLGIDLGIASQIEHPRLWAGLDAVSGACRTHGKVMGVGGIYDTTLTARLLAAGARFIAGGGDTAFLLTAASARAKFIRELAPAVSAA